MADASDREDRDTILNPQVARPIAIPEPTDVPFWFMSVPDFQTLMLPLLRFAGDGLEHSVAEARDPAFAKFRTRTVKASIGVVTIPEEEDVAATDSEIAAAPTIHTEIQAALLRLGAEMGYDVWVARNDRSRTFDDKQFAAFPRILSTLPVQFDEATKRTIELIDVLWLKGKAIVAAFEVESTTSIYSGLLRMSDLVSMQPNINLPLYLVAPDERRDKVFAEVNRPTFAALQPPLAELCRYIGFSTLREEIKKVEHVLQYLKPEFLEELSESCELGGE